MPRPSHASGPAVASHLPLPMPAALAQPLSWQATPVRPARGTQTTPRATPRLTLRQRVRQSLPTEQQLQSPQFLASAGGVLFLIAWWLMFSWSAKVVQLLLLGSAALIAFAAYAYVSERGLLSFLPPGLRRLLLETSLFELSQMPWTSQWMMDVITLFVVPLEKTDLQRLMQRLPPHVRATLSRKGLLSHATPKVRRLFVPERISEYGQQHPSAAGNAAGLGLAFPPLGSLSAPGAGGLHGGFSHSGSLAMQPGGNAVVRQLFPPAAGAVGLQQRDELVSAGAGFAGDRKSSVLVDEVISARGAGAGAPAAAAAKPAPLRQESKRRKSVVLGLGGDPQQQQLSPTTSAQDLADLVEAGRAAAGGAMGAGAGAGVPSAVAERGGGDRESILSRVLRRYLVAQLASRRVHSLVARALGSRHVTRFTRQLTRALMPLAASLPLPFPATLQSLKVLAGTASATGALQLYLSSGTRRWTRRWAAFALEASLYVAVTVALAGLIATRGYSSSNAGGAEGAAAAEAKEDEDSDRDDAAAAAAGAGPLGAVVAGSARSRGGAAGNALRRALRLLTWLRHGLLRHHKVLLSAAVLALWVAFLARQATRLRSAARVVREGLPLPGLPAPQQIL